MYEIDWMSQDVETESLGSEVELIPIPGGRLVPVVAVLWSGLAFAATLMGAAFLVRSPLIRLVIAYCAALIVTVEWYRRHGHLSRFLIEVLQANDLRPGSRVVVSRASKELAIVEIRDVEHFDDGSVELRALISTSRRLSGRTRIRVLSTGPPPFG